MSFLNSAGGYGGSGYVPSILATLTPISGSSAISPLPRRRSPSPSRSSPISQGMMFQAAGSWTPSSPSQGVRIAASTRVPLATAGLAATVPSPVPMPASRSFVCLSPGPSRSRSPQRADVSTDAAVMRLRAIEDKLRDWHSAFFQIQATLQDTGVSSVQKGPPSAPPAIKSLGPASFDAALRSLEQLSSTWEKEDIAQLRQSVLGCIQSAHSQSAKPCNGAEEKMRASPLSSGASEMQLSPQDAAPGTSSIKASSGDRTGTGPKPLATGNLGRCTKSLDSALGVLQRQLEAGSFKSKTMSDLEFVRTTISSVVEDLVAEDKHPLHEVEEHHFDEHTFQYLHSFGNKSAPKKRKRTFRQVAMAIMLARRLMPRHEKSQSSLPSEPSTNQYGLAELDHIDSWDAFDIFKVKESFGSFTLERITMTVYQHQNCLKVFQIRPGKLVSFLQAVEKQYLPNPYHTSLHAADVVQTVHALTKEHLQPGTLSEMEVLTMIFAAACHDVGHPGVTNQFRVVSADEGALTYNDISVNENMHCSLAYRILQKDECNFLDCLSPAQAAVVRKLMIEIVLSTDMAHHFAKLASFNRTIEEKGREFHRWDSASPALELMVHAADISGTTKDLHVAIQWADLVLEEFFAQGDKERALGRDISPLCDRNTVSRPGSQCGFVDFIVAPTFEALGKLVDAKKCQDNMKAYKSYFAELKELEDKEKEVKAAREAKAAELAERRRKKTDST